MVNKKGKKKGKTPQIKKGGVLRMSESTWHTKVPLPLSLALPQGTSLRSTMEASSSSWKILGR